MTHLINQLKFQINCPGEDEAFQLRHSFQDTLQEQIVNAVDKVCSDNVAEDEWIHIDQVEIDAGTFSSHSLYTDFDLVFRKKFEEELLRKISFLTEEKRKTSREDSWLELLIHFLQTGVLPWWAIEATTDLKKISRHLLTAHPLTCKSFFYSNLFQNIWTRAAFQLDSESQAIIISFFEKLGRAKEIMSAYASTLAKQLSISDLPITKGRSHIINSILILNGPLIFKEEEPGKLLRRLFVDHLEEILLVPADIPIAEVFSLFNKIAEDDVFNDVKGNIEFAFVENIEHTPFDQHANKQPLKYIVKTAGVILLAPFLQRLFLKLNLYDKSGWIAKDSVFRAVHILKFLASGEQNVPEYRLVLEKLLCGLSPEQPIPLEVALDRRRD